MNTYPPSLEPSTPDPALSAMLFRLLRWVLTIAVALGSTWAASISDAALSVVAGAVLECGLLVWSIYEEIAASRRAHADRVASAEASAEATAHAGIPQVIAVKAPA